MNEAAAAHGGQADVNPMEDHGSMYTLDLADPDGHVWAALWMDTAVMPADAVVRDAVSTR
jgi:predicted lactoylglutathione lyase